jgi:hypothetical protein
MRVSRFSLGAPAGCALAAALCLLAGYIDLWRGGNVVAPVLLVLGYVVLVPLALCVPTSQRPPERSRK